MSQVCASALLVAFAPLGPIGRETQAAVTALQLVKSVNAARILSHNVGVRVMALHSAPVSTLMNDFLVELDCWSTTAARIIQQINGL